MAQAVILIPARYESSRFPGKPLATIFNKPMIQIVYENMKVSNYDAAVVTDNDEIEKLIKKIKGTVYRVDDPVPSGSERIALAAERFLDSQYEFIVNVQGDEPLLTGGDVQKLVEFHIKNPQFEITTLSKKRTGSEIENPNIVKLVMSDSTKQCLYFSRSAIPHDRDHEEQTWFQHIGVYCYRAAALQKFVKLQETKLEGIEKLEQLRALENGLAIGALETEAELIGVDRPEDIGKVENFLRERI